MADLSVKQESTPLRSGLRRASIEKISAFVVSVPDLPYLCLVLTMTVLAGLPLFQAELMDGHDARAYLPRSVEFWEGLKNGRLFPRWAPDLGAGYGEPMFNFTPPFLHYVTSLFHAIGFNFVTAENLSLFAILCIAALGMYFLAAEFFGRRGGLVSSVAYLFAPYVLVTLYVRHALADFSAFAPLPWAFWGTYRFSATGSSRPLFIAALSVLLLLLSSNSVTIMALPALVLLVAWLSWHDRSLRIFVRGCLALGFGLGLSAFFWLPALAEMDYVHISRRVESLNFHDHFLYVYQLIYSPWGYGLSLPGTKDDGMSFAIGPIYILLGVLALFLRKRVSLISAPAGTMVSFCLVLGLSATFFATNESLFLWEWLTFLPALQFPWRFLSLIAFGTAFLCGFPILLFRQNRKAATGLMVLLIAVLLATGLPHAAPMAFLDVVDADYTPERIASEAIEADIKELEPVWVKERPSTPSEERLILLDGEGDIVAAKLSPFAYEFRVNIVRSARLRLNTFYFPGWRLFVDGVERPFDYSNRYGLMEFLLEEGPYLIQARFTDTPVREWSQWISLVAFPLLIATAWLTRRSNFV